MRQKVVRRPITEAQHQAAVITWSQQPSIREKWPEVKLLHHIPNGGTRNVIEGKQLKRHGVKSGVPDLCLPVARGGYHGLYIEMKRANGNAGDVSDNQNWWIPELQKQGYYSIICYGYEAAVEVLTWYMMLTNLNNG